MREEGILARVFVAALKAPASVPESLALDEALRALHAAGSSAWPGIVLSAPALAAHLGRHATAKAPLPSLDISADLYLACACALGVPGAAAAFERSFAEVIARAIRRVDASPAFVEDAGQEIRARLLVRSGEGPPKIAEYAGRAPLHTWLRTLSVRTALSLRRGKKEHLHEELAPEDDLLIADADPEMGYLKARYQPQFEASIHAALAKLDARERTLLRLHLVEGMSIDALGAHYRVGRSTAARWLASARKALFEHTRAELTALLDLEPSEFESLVALVRSRLDVSARRLLGEVTRVPR